MNPMKLPIRLLLAGLCTLGPAMAQGDTAYRVVPIAIEHDQAFHPDGVAVGPEGAAYFCCRTVRDGRLQAEILRVEPDGRAHHFARLPAAPAGWISPQATSVGLAVDGTGRVFVTHATFEPGTHGVYRIDVRGADVTRLPGTAQIALPNGIALDGQGRCYVTDGGQGAIWQGATDGRTAFRSILQSGAFRPGSLCPTGIPLPGVQGIVCAGPRRLFVANAGRGRILRIDLDAKARPRAPVTVAAHWSLTSVAGLALLPDGDLVATVRGGRLLVAPTLLRIETGDGAIEPFAPSLGRIYTPRAVACHPALGPSILLVQGQPFDGSIGFDVGLLRIEEYSAPMSMGRQTSSGTLTFRDASTDRIGSDGKGAYTASVSSTDSDIVSADTGRRSLRLDFTQRTSCGSGVVPCASPFAGSGDVGSVTQVKIGTYGLDLYDTVYIRMEFSINNQDYVLTASGTVVRSDTDNDQKNDTFVVTGSSAQLNTFVLEQESQPGGTARGHHYSWSEYWVATYSMPYQLTFKLQ